MKKTERLIIPRKTIYRLSIYLRCLARLHEKGIGTVSSEALAKAAGVKSTQLRKDLAYFGKTYGRAHMKVDIAGLDVDGAVNAVKAAAEPFREDAGI